MQIETTEKYQHIGWKFRVEIINKLTDLAGVVQWFESQLENHKVADSIPSQGT